MSCVPHFNTWLWQANSPQTNESSKLYMFGNDIVIIFQNQHVPNLVTNDAREKWFANSDAEEDTWMHQQQTSGSILYRFKRRQELLEGFIHTAKLNLMPRPRWMSSCGATPTYGNCNAPFEARGSVMEITTPLVWKLPPPYGGR